MRNDFFLHEFSNGLTLVAERLEGVRSAAFTILLPGGAAYDPLGKDGMAAIMTDMITRGAGERNSRELTMALENLGVQRGEGVETRHLSMVASTLSANLDRVFDIYADLIRRPHLPKEEMEAARALAIQELRGLDDEPRQKVLIELKRRHYPLELGRPTMGTLEGLESITHPDLVSFHQSLIRPQGAIIAVAGDIHWDALRDKVGELFDDWEVNGPSPAMPTGARGPKVSHLEQDTTQTQIGLAYKSVPYRSDGYFQAQGAVTVLSGGSSSRLFTEVREKRGLCYSVYASYQSTRDLASVVAYAGTTVERAQETLDLTIQEIERLPKDIEESELARAKAGLKSSLIMQGESSSARSSAVAADWYHLGRVRQFDEVQNGIDSLTPESIMSHLKNNPPGDYTVVTIGPKPLSVPAS